MTEVNEFTPPEELSSPERIAIMNGYRDQIRGDGEDPSEEELKYGIELMRTERSVSAGRTAEKKASKAAPVPVSLDDI